MCLAPSIPKPPPPPEAPKQLETTAAGAKAEQARRAALMAGLSGTLKTGGMGVASSPSVAVKTLLGQ